MPETKGKHFEDIADDFANRTADLDAKDGGDGESAGAMLGGGGGGGGVMSVESAAAEYERRSSLAC